MKGLWHKNSISEGAPSTSLAKIPSTGREICSLCGPRHYSLAAWLSHIATEHTEFCASATVLGLLTEKERLLLPLTLVWWWSFTHLYSPFLKILGHKRWFSLFLIQSVLQWEVPPKIIAATMYYCHKMERITTDFPPAKKKKFQVEQNLEKMWILLLWRQHQLSLQHSW